MRFLNLWLLLAVLFLAGVLGFSSEMRRVVRMEATSLGGPIGYGPSYWWMLHQWERSWERASRGTAGKDWQLVWGAAELKSLLGRGISIPEFQRAVALNPESRALRCRAAIALSYQISFTRSDESNVYQGGAPPKPGTKEEPPDPAKVAAALKALDEATRQDPDNGLLDWHSAHVLFAAQRDAEANEALKRMAAKPRWEDYKSDAARAAAHQARWAGWPRYWAAADGWSAAVHLSAQTNVRWVTKWLSAWARVFEEQGRDQEAIERWRVTFAFGQKMRTSATTVVDILMAAIATEGAAGTAGMWRLPKEELESLNEYSAGPGGRKGGQYELQQELRLERFCSYLSDHGASDLAPRVRADVAASEFYRQALHRAGPFDLSKPPTSYSIRLTLAQSGQSLFLACLVLLTAFFLLSWLGRRPRVRPRVGLMPLAFAIVIVAPIAWWWMRVPAVTRDVPKNVLAFAPSWWWAPVVTVGPVALFLAACWIVTVVSRRRRACVRGRRWFLLHWFGNVNIASLWAIAILLTLLLLLFIPIQVYGARLEAYYAQVLAKGELAVRLGW